RAHSPLYRAIAVLTGQSEPGCAEPQRIYRARAHPWVAALAVAETTTAQRRKAAQGIVKRRERRDTRPQEIVAAAFEEFAQHGYAGTRLEDVAARARVSKGLPYLYFKTKVELFKAVVKSVIT